MSFSYDFVGDWGSMGGGGGMLGGLGGIGGLLGPLSSILGGGGSQSSSESSNSSSMIAMPSNIPEEPTFYDYYQPSGMLDDPGAGINTADYYNQLYGGGTASGQLRNNTGGNNQQQRNSGMNSNMLKQMSSMLGDSSYGMSPTNWFSGVTGNYGASALSAYQPLSYASFAPAVGGTLGTTFGTGLGAGAGTGLGYAGALGGLGSGSGLAATSTGIFAPSAAYSGAAAATSGWLGGLGGLSGSAAASAGSLAGSLGLGAGAGGAAGAAGLGAGAVGAGAAGAGAAGAGAAGAGAAAGGAAAGAVGSNPVGWIAGIIAALTATGVALGEGHDFKEVFGGEGWGGTPVALIESLFDGNFGETLQDEFGGQMFGGLGSWMGGEGDSLNLLGSIGAPFRKTKKQKDMEQNPEKYMPDIDVGWTWDGTRKKRLDKIAGNSWTWNEGSAGKSSGGSDWKW